MSASIPNGTIISIASALAIAVPFSALTNANPAVAASVAHGLDEGAVVAVKSGWGGLDGRVARIANPTEDAFTLENVNTASAVKFPAGAGAGSVREVTGWTQITQVTDSTSSGGEQQFVQWVFLEDGIQRQKPTFKNARSLVLTLADDPSLPWNAILKAADEDGEPRVVRFQLPNGGAIYYSMYVSFNDEPTLAANQIMSVSSTMSLVAPSTRYAS